MNSDFAKKHESISDGIEKTNNTFVGVGSSGGQIQFLDTDNQVVDSRGDRFENEDTDIDFRDNNRKVVGDIGLIDTIR